MAYIPIIHGLTKRIHTSPLYFHKRDFTVLLLATISGVLVGFLAELLKSLIALVTNISFYYDVSFTPSVPSISYWGLGTILIPALGGLFIGFLAKFVHSGVTGHGLPETLEKILLNNSLIPKRLVFLKPIAAAVSVGTGGPFGDEGPIIATGGALGSAVGQILKTTISERKTLLASGVAAAVSAAFGSPLGGIFLAIELLLFEIAPRTIIPVSLAALSSFFVRLYLVGQVVPFHIDDNYFSLSAQDLLPFILLGIFFGLCAVGISHGVFWTEKFFEKLPISWYWWPCLGGLIVGVIGYFDPRVMGAGYTVIERLLQGHVLGISVVSLFAFKLVAWLVGMGSRTTAGTLAPLFLLGSSLGVISSLILQQLGLWMDPPVSLIALVGMGAVFAGVTRAFISSFLISLECTHAFGMSIPLLIACLFSYGTSIFLMQHSLITHSLAKKGIILPHEQLEPSSSNKKHQP